MNFIINVKNERKKHVIQAGKKWICIEISLLHSYKMIKYLLLLSERLWTQNNTVNHVIKYIILLRFQWRNFPPSIYRLQNLSPLLPVSDESVQVPGDRLDICWLRHHLALNARSDQKWNKTQNLLDLSLPKIKIKKKKIFLLHF